MINSNIQQILSRINQNLDSVNNLRCATNLKTFLYVTDVSIGNNPNNFTAPSQHIQKLSAPKKTYRIRIFKMTVEFGTRDSIKEFDAL